MNLRELSEHLGLSQTTVSRALNGYPEVSEKTRKRVQDAAERYGYTPNPRAQSLATGKTKAIAHIIPVSDSHELVNPIFGDFIAGAAMYYREHGYDLMLSVVEDSATEAAYREIATRGSVDGIVLQAPRVEDWRIPLLAEIGVPFVVHGRSSGCTTPYAYVDINNRTAFAQLAQHLIDQGHRRIGFLNGNEINDFAARRRQAVDETLRAAGIAPDPALVSSGTMTEGAGYQGVRRMLGLDDPPTALICASMMQAIGARRATHEARTDLPVVTHDDMLSYLANGDDAPIFTATRSSVHEAGQICAELLLERVKSPDAPMRSVLLEADFVMADLRGESSAPQTTRQQPGAQIA